MIAALGAGCDPELGSCDPDRARDVVYEGSGLPAYEGQALLVQSCGSGSFCHSADIAERDRFGAPAGLAFDVQLVAADGVVEEASIVRQRRARFRVVQEARSILGTVDGATMPPPASAGSEVSEVLEGAPVFTRAEGGQALPAIDSAEGRELLRNWLACGAPLVERGASRDDGADAVVEEPLFIPPIEPNWPSIFENLVGSARCASPRCHGGEPRAGFRALNSSETYAALVGQPAGGDECGTEHTLIVPGDAASSLFLSKLGGSPACGGAMPLNQIPVRQSSLDAIAAWIDCGAPEGAEGCAAP